MANSDTVMDYVADNATNKFEDRVKFFFQKAAVAVMAEADTVENHAARVDFAGQVLSGDFPNLQLAIAVATNATITATIVTPATPSDGDIEYTVNSMIDAFALSVV